MTSSNETIQNVLHSWFVYQEFASVNLLQYSTNSNQNTSQKVINDSIHFSLTQKQSKDVDWCPNKGPT